ncbi:TIGR03564 family F420-dependent LLM class oxidoreductase [Gordonia sp. NPDC003376]
MEISIYWSLADAGPVVAIDAYIDELNNRREEGFRRTWTTQMPDEPDLLTVLAVAAREVPDIEVATGVLPVQPQHPASLAQRALTVNAILGGRLVLGLGLSHRVVTERMWGIPYDRPITRMGEYLDGLLPLLRGEKAAVDGDIITTRGRLAITAPQPPVYLAALGPRMLDLAGTRTAGTVTWMTGPVTVRDHIVPGLRGAARAAGRARGDVRVVTVLPVCVTDDVDAARAVAAEKYAMYGYLPSYRAMLDREGAEGPADVAIIGDEASVAAELDRLGEAGVDEFVGITFDPDPEGRARTRMLLRSRDIATPTSEDPPVGDVL